MSRRPMIAPLRAPFPWFGGKSRASQLIWTALGDVPNYVEPFAGSLAVLLGRPTEARRETVNDKDTYLANVWRAIHAAPDAVADWCSDPVNEADLHARHVWLIAQAGFRERMLTEPEFYDAKIAGWWLWGICAWIGRGWCAYRDPPLEKEEGKTARPWRQIPYLSDAGRGVHSLRARPWRQIPHLSDAGVGVHALRFEPRFFKDISDRLRNVRVACGEWDRILGESVTVRQGLTGILLDPPYSDLAGRDPDIYSCDSLTVAHAVREWAIDNGANKNLRIALCGYEGEHEMPASWQCIPWKAGGGYGSRNNENAKSERIWFSPACLPIVAAQGALFAGGVR